MTTVATPRQSIRFHGRSYHAMVLSPEPPLADWLAGLDAWLARSPGFFFGRPVVLDLAVLQPGKQGVAELLQNLAERNIKVMGIEGAEPSWLDFAMPPLLLSGRQANSIPGDHPPAAAEAPAPALSSDPAPDAAAAPRRGCFFSCRRCPRGCHQLSTRTPFCWTARSAPVSASCTLRAM